MKISERIQVKALIKISILNFIVLVAFAGFVYKVQPSFIQLVLALCLVLLLVTLSFYFIVSGIVSPLKAMAQKLNLLSSGDTEAVQLDDYKSKDELFTMNDSINKVAKNLKSSSGHALNIGNGNLDEAFELLGDNDKLGMALKAMQTSLVVSNKAEEERKKEEEIRNWSNLGIAKFNEIFRKNSDSLASLGSHTISNLIEYLKVNQGALFALNDTDEEKPFFELVTAVAYGREKHFEKNIYAGEGLVGRCVFERKTIYMTEIPEEYSNITSGLGSANPTSILLVPCIINDEVFSVIELASFNKFTPYEIEFVETLAEGIASTISNVQINEKTTELLKQSKQQSEEMTAQEEELRQNLEEMESTQEDLQRQMAQNAVMRDEMRKNTALLDALLSLLPDFIYFKDSESRFLRVSKSMLSLFDAVDENEIIGKSDFDYHTKENAQKYYNDEKEIQNKKEGFVDLLQQETKVDGSKMWNSVTKMPLVDADGNVFGTFGISKNVTDIKELEVEAQRQREESSKQKTLLDSLMTTLPDFVFFKDLDSKFLRISNSLLSLFDAEKEIEVLGKSDFDFQAKEEAQVYYDEEQEIIKSRKGFENKVIKEILKDGSEHWSSITKLPLVNEKDEVIGTFGISKDVTDLKKKKKK